MNNQSIRVFSDVLFFMERENPNKIAFRWIDEDDNIREKTYSDFCLDIHRGISYLQKIVETGEEKHIAILARNSYDYAVVLYACLIAGMVVVPLNLQKSTEEILNELSDSETDIVLHDGEFVDREVNFTDRFTGQLLPLDGYEHYPEEAFWTEPSPSTLAAIYFTSGTTDRSKGVMLNQRSMCSSSAGFSEMNDYYRMAEKVSEHNTVNGFVVSPFYHLGGFGMLLSTLVEGGTANLNRSVKYFFRDITLMESNVAFLPPIILEMIEKRLRRSSKSFLNGLNVICTGSAPVSADTLRALKNNNIIVLPMYGLTECFSIVLMNLSQDDARLMSVGKPIFPSLLDTQLRITDSELYISGDSLMLGYYNDPLETEKAIDKGGWLHTGDLVRQDENGYYYITGRKKNLIVLSSGENINPEEIETQLLKNDNIFECIVKEQDNRIVAEVFCESSKKQEVEAFVKELNRTIPLYKHISAVEFRDIPFERTATGKIKRI